MSEEENISEEKFEKENPKPEEVNETIKQIATSDIITSDIQNMEVHHYPHADSHLHEKKNFKEYFLEFLMIFLAVTTKNYMIKYTS